MMKLIAVALLIVAGVFAAELPPKEPVKILSSEFEKDPQGSYKFGFESEDGIKRDEEGELKDIVDDENKPHTVVVVRGSFSYTNADGKPEKFDYYADETGFHIDGDSVPKAPTT